MTSLSPKIEPSPLGYLDWEGLDQFWLDKLAKAEAALEARREWLKAVRLSGTLFYSDRAELAEVEMCKRVLAGHAERAAREERIAKRHALGIFFNVER